MPHSSRTGSAGMQPVTTGQKIAPSSVEAGRRITFYDLLPHRLAVLICPIPLPVGKNPSPAPPAPYGARKPRQRQAGRLPAPLT